jgi:hypothetical protein
MRILALLVDLAAKGYNRPGPAVVQHKLKERTMQRRDMLEAMLRAITDIEFNAVWKDAYGYVPEGKRSDLVTEFVAEQYDKELDGCIKRTELLLKPAPKAKPNNRWLVPR